MLSLKHKLALCAAALSLLWGIGSASAVIEREGGGGGGGGGGGTLCGNGTCGLGEDCSTCPLDCGSCCVPNGSCSGSCGTSGVDNCGNACATNTCDSGCPDATTCGTCGNAACAPTSSVWTNIVNVTVTDTSMTRTAGVSTGWTAGASTIGAITSAKGHLTFKAGQTDTYKMFGLSNGDTNQAYGDIDYAFYMKSGGTLDIREKGVSIGNFGTYTTSSNLRIDLIAGKIRYLRDGVILYTSAVAPVLPLIVDSSLYNGSASVTGIALKNGWVPAVSDGTWNNIVSVTTTASSITRLSGSGWTAGASSVASIPGDGYLDFTAGQTGTNRMIGLSNGDTNQAYGDIDFAWYLRSSNDLQVRENGTSKGGFGAYTATTQLRVQVQGTTVNYLKDGAVVYTSAIAPTFPLLVDTALYSGGAKVTNLTLVGGTPPATCGDSVCSGAENCSSCPGDCGSCPVICGDGTCEAGTESCESCQADCGICPAAQPFTALPLNWVNKANVSSTSTSLTKTNAYTWPYSASAMASDGLVGDGYMQFSAGSLPATGSVFAGLANSHMSAHYDDIAYAISVTSSGFSVYENGASKTYRGSTYVSCSTSCSTDCELCETTSCCTHPTASDVFRVEVVNSQVLYKRNGKTFFASSKAPSFPLFLDTSLGGWTSGTGGKIIKDISFARATNAIVNAGPGRRILYLHGRSMLTWPAGAFMGTPLNWEHKAMGYDGSARLMDEANRAVISQTIEANCSGTDQECVIMCYSAGCARLLIAFDDLEASGTDLPGLLWVGATASAAGGSHLAEIATRSSLLLLTRIFLTGPPNPLEAVDHDLGRSQMRVTYGYIQDAAPVPVYHLAGSRDICVELSVAGWLEMVLTGISTYTVVNGILSAIGPIGWLIMGLKGLIAGWIKEKIVKQCGNDKLPGKYGDGVVGVHSAAGYAQIAPYPKMFTRDANGNPRSDDKYPFRAYEQEDLFDVDHRGALEPLVNTGSLRLGISATASCPSLPSWDSTGVESASIVYDDGDVAHSELAPAAMLQMCGADVLADPLLYATCNGVNGCCEDFEAASTDGCTCGETMCYQTSFRLRSSYTGPNCSGDEYTGQFGPNSDGPYTLPWQATWDGRGMVGGERLDPETDVTLRSVRLSDGRCVPIVHDHFYEQQGEHFYTLTEVSAARTRRVWRTHIDNWGEDPNAISDPNQGWVGSRYTAAGCFAANTQVTMADGSTRAIQDIEVGDRVKAFDESTGMIVQGTVTETFIHHDIEGLSIVNGIQATPNHPFYANGDWIRADALNVGDRVLMLGSTAAAVGQPMTPTDFTVERLEYVPGTNTVYNIEVDTHHNYFAGGILVHNK